MSSTGRQIKEERRKIDEVAAVLTSMLQHAREIFEDENTCGAGGEHGWASAYDNVEWI